MVAQKITKYAKITQMLAHNRQLISACREFTITSKMSGAKATALAGHSHRLTIVPDATRQASTEAGHKSAATW